MLLKQCFLNTKIKENFAEEDFIRGPEENGSKRILIDIPECVLIPLDEQAKRLNLSRQDLIAVWLNDKINKGTC